MIFGVVYGGGGNSAFISKIDHSTRFMGITRLVRRMIPDGLTCTYGSTFAICCHLMVFKGCGILRQTAENCGTARQPLERRGNL
jgi:hypothetical protein